MSGNLPVPPDDPRETSQETSPSTPVVAINQNAVTVKTYDRSPAIEVVTRKRKVDPSKIKKFRVDVFTKEASIQVKLAAGSHRYFIAGSDKGGEGSVCSYPNVITVGEVKEKVRQALKLKSSSGKIFGLFLGPLGFPTALLHDADPVPQDTTIFSLQRLSFNQEEEVAATSEDNRALELIFEEARYMFEYHNIRPKTTLIQHDALLGIILDGNVIRPEFSLKVQNLFLHSVRSLPHYYWSYYYYASNCILLSYVSYSLRVSVQMTIVADIEKLIFLDILSDEQLASWPWENVSSVKIQESRNLIAFDLIDQERKGDILKYVTVEVDHCKYLFTMITHILRIHEARRSRPLLSDVKDIAHPTINATEPYMENGFLVFANQTFIPIPSTDDEEPPQWCLSNDYATKHLKRSQDRLFKVLNLS